MSRPTVLTRPAVAADVPTLQALWDELRQVGGRAERAINPTVAVDVREHLLKVIDDPSCRVVLATVDDVPAGMAVMRTAQPDPLSDATVVHVVHLVVSRANRERGIGHALLAAAADFAAERHIDHVAVSVYPSLRDVSRFYARLGFAAVAVRRIVPVNTLRRRLGSESGLTMVSDGVRRRGRAMRPVPSQRSRRGLPERLQFK